MITESIYLSLNSSDTLHIKRIGQADGDPVLLIHGQVENGRIFYSNSGKGLAPYLADQGFDCYVLDLRGRGESRPKTSGASRFTQYDLICGDIPASAAKIRELRGDRPQIWMAHSWGGVLATAALARFPHLCRNVRKAVYFGAKRRVRVKNFHRLLYIDIVWNRVCRWLVRKDGFLDARRYGIGSDSESAATWRDCVAWVKADAWEDCSDAFDYHTMLKKIDLPPILYVAAINDRCLGHPADVRLLMDESESRRAELRLIGKNFGNHHNYGHINMLTHPDCIHDHFPAIVQWLKS